MILLVNSHASEERSSRQSSPSEEQKQAPLFPLAILKFFSASCNSSELPVNSGSVPTSTQTHVQTPYFLMKRKQKPEEQVEIWYLSRDRKLWFPLRKLGILWKEVGVTHRPVVSLCTSAPASEICKMVMTVTQGAGSMSESPETFLCSRLFLRANVHMHTAPVRRG